MGDVLRPEAAGGEPLCKQLASGGGGGGGGFTWCEWDRRAGLRCTAQA